MLIEQMQTMDHVLSDQLALQRAQSFTVGLFAVLALLLAAVGLYGLLSWLVSQQLPELGVRVALGASRGNIFAVVARRGLLLTGGGIALGSLAAVALVRALRNQVFGLRTFDPWAAAGAALLLLAVAFLACWLPARRATRVDPLSALR